MENIDLHENDFMEVKEDIIEIFEESDKNQKLNDKKSELMKETVDIRVLDIILIIAIFTLAIFLIIISNIYLLLYNPTYFVYPYRIYPGY
ncbi:MAG: hypothetical protein GY870_07015 [archaeon]|nr:hypothetical protein [archaeon]